MERAVPSWLILCAVAIGGALRAPIAGPERALEGALVVAGVVEYPPSSLMANYYLDSWTLLHQAGALGLLAGIDQRIVELAFCVLPSGLMLGAFTMLVYGFCRHPLFSLSVATICFLTGVVADRFASPDYPLMGVTWDRAASHTYGLWAGAMAAWFFGALAGGRNVMAGASAALLVAVHPVIGAYVACVAIVVVVVGRLLSSDLPVAGLGRGLLWGAPATAVSFGAYLAMRPPGNADLDASAFETYMAVWEFHRNVAMPPAAVILKPVVVLAGALLAVLAISRGRRSSTDVGILALLVTIVASCALYFSVHLAPGLLPEIVERAMPARLLNLHASVSGAIAVGIAAWSTDRVLSRIRSGRRPDLVRVLTSPAAVYALLAALLALVVDPVTPLRAFGSRTMGFVQNRLPYYRAADPFWSAVRTSGVHGPVLASFGSRYAALVGGHLSVAFDPTGFDFIPYLPHTARDVQRFVERGYGVSFSDPPSELRFRSALEGDPQRAYWEGLTAGQWSALGAELVVAGVVAPSDWAMRLPPRVPGPHFTLYAIPPEE